MRETWVRYLGWEDPLEKEMATHSSILAWEMPWTKEAVRLQSMGLQRVRHDWASSLTLFRNINFQNNYLLGLKSHVFANPEGNIFFWALNIGILLITRDSVNIGVAKRFIQVFLYHLLKKTWTNFLVIPILFTSYLLLTLTLRSKEVNKG